MFNLKSANKKAVTEIVSFVLLTLLVVVASSVSYLFSTNMIDNSISKTDTKNSNIYLKDMIYNIDSISNFQDSTTSMNLNFNSGGFFFEGNQIYFQSTQEYVGLDICLDKLCFKNVNGFERIYFNLSNSYTIYSNFSLVPGLYKLTFTNIKNESKILIKVN